MDNDRIDPLVWKISAVVFLGPFMTSLDATVVNVSLSTFASDLHASLESAQWVISGYLLALALMLPINGWIVDRVGAKRVYLACFSAFTVASLLCGMAKTMDQLIGFRLLQGMAGGLLAPMAQMMVARIAGKQMARVMGYMVVPILIAPILGPVVAGSILKFASWPWLFYLNLPVGIVAVILASIILPKDEISKEQRPFDLPGFLLLSPALALLLFGLEHSSHGHEGMWSLLVAVPLFLMFIWHAKRKQKLALIDISLFKNFTFSVAAATQFLSNGAAFAGQMLVPLFLINGCGFSPTEVGWMLAPMGIGMMVTFPLMGYLTDRFGCRGVSANGSLVTLLGTIPFLWMSEAHVSVVLLGFSLFFRGAGMAAVNIPTVAAAYSAVPKDRLPIATTAINIVQRLGGPIATTLAALILVFARGSAGDGVHDPHAFTAAFIFLVCLHVMMLLISLKLPIQVHQKKAELNLQAAEGLTE